MKKFDNKFDRYPFSQLPKRPTYNWPNGAKLAVYFALNVEAFELAATPGQTSLHYRPRRFTAALPTATTATGLAFGAYWSCSTATRFRWPF